MTDFQGLLDGFATALSVENFGLLLLGVAIGTLVGALPGLGPTASIALLLPFAMTLSPVSALILLGAVYYGSQYGGTLTAVLVNVPGEVSSVVTAIEGHQMAKQGRAGLALYTAAIASFIAGTIGVVLLMVLGVTLGAFALFFGPPEYFAVYVLALSLVVTLVGKSPSKGLIAAAAGIGIGLIGTDPLTSAPRLQFGIDGLFDGVGIIAAAIGLFGIGEVLDNLYTGRLSGRPAITGLRLREMIPTRGDLRQVAGPIGRGSIIGYVVGLLPGAGVSIASFLAYGIERRRGKSRVPFGKGSIEGLAAPEAANNSAAAGAMTTMMSLGVPGSPTTALLLFALVTFGVQVGPGVFDTHPHIVWPFIASMYLGNVLLVLLNTLAVPLWVSLVRVGTPYLNAIIIALCLIGVYGSTLRMFDVWVALVFGILGFAMRRLDYPVAPMVLGLVLASGAERALRQSLIMSGGDFAIFATRPVSIVVATLTVAMIVAPFAIRAFRRRRAAAPLGKGAGS